jgi:hypothetical protein
MSSSVANKINYPPAFLHTPIPPHLLIPLNEEKMRIHSVFIAPPTASLPPVFSSAETLGGEFARPFSKISTVEFFNNGDDVPLSRSNVQLKYFKEWENFFDDDDPDDEDMPEIEIYVDILLENIFVFTIGNLVYSFLNGILNAI